MLIHVYGLFLKKTMNIMSSKRYLELSKFNESLELEIICSTLTFKNAVCLLLHIFEDKQFEISTN